MEMESTIHGGGVYLGHHIFFTFLEVGFEVEIGLRGAYL